MRDGEGIKSKRVLIGLTQEELAAKSGVSVRTIRSIEGGKAARASSVRALSAALDFGTSENAGLPRPAQLPADVADFVGRSDSVAMLDSASVSRATCPVIITIDGSPGVGKTALAVRWSHSVRDEFTDGQLYINLRGADSRSPVQPKDALAIFLRAFGVAPTDIPLDEDETAALYRSTLAGKRVLIVIDNAADAEQVRPLLPGAAPCTVIVTSRNRLDQLVVEFGAQRLSLGPLPPTDAATMLHTLLRSQRTLTNDSVAELAKNCGHLPLALRVSGTSLAARLEQVGLRHGITQLRVGHRELNIVYQTFDLSYCELTANTQQAFRRLGLIPGPDFTAEIVAKLCACTVNDAEPLLADLAEANLITEHATGRYRFHHLLLRGYALSRVKVDEEPARVAAALRRLFDHYLQSAPALVRRRVDERIGGYRANGDYGAAELLSAAHRSATQLPPET